MLSISLLGISRLWTLVDIFGELKLVDACLKEVEPQHVIMQAAFEPIATPGEVAHCLLVSVSTLENGDGYHTLVTL